MQMHSPPHPGEFIEGVYLEPCELSIRQVAERLGVSASTLQRLVAGKSRVTPDMALRLSRVLGRSAESWLAMQDSHDLCPPSVSTSIQTHAARLGSARFRQSTPDLIVRWLEDLPADAGGYSFSAPVL
jgi:addiction module HigA family antidote